MIDRATRLGSLVQFMHFIVLGGVLGGFGRVLGGLGGFWVEGPQPQKPEPAMSSNDNFS